MTDRWEVAAAILGTRFPVIQAGMGGVAGPELAAAVSDAGALGTVGLYRTPAGACRSMVQQTQRLTAATFGVNLIPEVAGPDLLAEQLEAVLDTTDRTITVTVYGPPSPGMAATVRSAGHVLAVQLGTSEELVETDADVLVAQGCEAGGHHLGTRHLLELTAEVARRRPGRPLLAAGGISNARTLRAALVAGAWGVQAGTAFAATRESRAHPDYKRFLVDAVAADTCVTTRFEIGWPGRAHRALRNAVTESLRPPTAEFVAVQRDERGRKVPIARGSANVPTESTTGNVREMACYAGTGVSAVVDIPPASQMVARLSRAFHPLASAHA